MRRTGHETGSSLRRASRGAATLFALVTIVAACSAPAGATDPPASTPVTTPAGSSVLVNPGLVLGIRADPALGNVVVGEDGMSLYVFTTDSAGFSKCTGQCAESWPPLVTSLDTPAAAGPGVTGEVGLFLRADGTNQVSLGGAPLYYFAADEAAGDIKGQGVGGVWYLVSAAGEPVGQASATPDGSKPDGTACTGRSCY